MAVTAFNEKVRDTLRAIGRMPPVVAVYITGSVVMVGMQVAIALLVRVLDKSGASVTTLWNLTRVWESCFWLSAGYIIGVGALLLVSYTYADSLKPDTPWVPPPSTGKEDTKYTLRERMFGRQ